MQAHEFNIPTSWRIKGNINAVYDILSTPEDFVRWWPDVYLQVQQLKAGDEDGVGRVVSLRSKGKLPYVLSWQAQALEVEKPYRMLIQAQGDLEGRGEWRLHQDGDWVLIQYDWTVIINRLWMNYLAFLLKPVFVANHHWAMAKGKQGLQRELQKLIIG